jgi:hypothetical protein
VGVRWKQQGTECRLDDGTEICPTAPWRRLVQRGDAVTPLSSDSHDVLIERGRPRSTPQYFLCASIGHVAATKHVENSSSCFLRAELLNATKPKSLWISADAIWKRFYQVDPTRPSETLYSLLGASELATPCELRLAWRVRTLEFELGEAKATNRIEQAFNILARPEVRDCYDALRRDEQLPPLFPYFGFGSIIVEGNLSRDGQTFFADRIIAYKPETTARRVSLRLRGCEFLRDHVVCRDPHRRIEVRLDASLLPGVEWDVTWNHWKHWLRGRIHVDATFVGSGEFQLHEGERVLRSWHTALPSRIQIRLPDDIADDIDRAKAIHALLGEHTDVVERIRSEAQRQPVEHVQIQDWLDQLGSSTHLKPQHVTWRPDYDPYYFEQLRKRCRTWFLCGDHYLFVLRNVLVSEVPQSGHATYVFAKPADLEAFMRGYSQTTRECVRRNRDNIATQLGFIGRVIRGKKRERWLQDVLKLAGEKVEYMEAAE